jgi:hypothetical protein
VRTRTKYQPWPILLYLFSSSYSEVGRLAERVVLNPDWLCPLPVGLETQLSLTVRGPVSPTTIRINTLHGRRDSSVGIATGYGLGGRGVGVRVAVGAKSFSLSASSRPDLGPTQPPIQWVPGALSLGREADHAPPTGAEVRITWICTSTPPYALMA